MPCLLEDLEVTRVDLVDEGANSAAFIELYKRKEQSEIMNMEEIFAKMKPEHAQIIKDAIEALTGDVTKTKLSLDTITTECNKAKQDLTVVSGELKKAKSDIAILKASQPDTCECDGEEDEQGMCKVCGKPKKKVAFDEEETLKSMPAGARVIFAKMRAQKEAAEEEVRKAREAEKNAEAIAKAAELKALPIESTKLTAVLKNCSTDMVDVLTTINAAIEGTVLNEVGKSSSGKGNSDSWVSIEAKAAEIVKRDNVTKQKAVSIAIKENPKLYKDYLQGGAN